MSSTLNWRPIAPIPDDCRLPFAIKKAIARKYWDHDGSLAGEPRIFDCTDFEYLEGVRDGGCPDIQIVIDLISKHGAIELFWET